MELPDPDTDTTLLLMEVANSGPVAAAQRSAEIMSAVVCFLLAGIGAEQTAEILRGWAAEVETMDVPLKAMTLS